MLAENEVMAPAQSSIHGHTCNRDIDSRETPCELDSLYHHHYGWLRDLLRRRLGSACDAADLAHDVFVHLLVRPREFDSFSGARAWLSTVAKGLCIDLWRRREIERAWLATLAAQEGEAPSAEDQAIVIEALCQVDALLQRLPAKVARAFLLSQLEGLTYREIAEILAVSERMVKKYMAQAILHCALFESEFSPDHSAGAPALADAARDS